MKKHTYNTANTHAKSIFLFFIFLMMMSGNMIAQHTVTPAPQITPGGYFDIVYDQYGNPYNLAGLSLTSGNPMGKTIGGGGQTINSLPTASCSAGYFNVYYAPNTYWTTVVATQTALCQVLLDISNHIPSPLWGNGNKINIYCDTIPSGGTTLGTASAFFLVPNNPSNPNQGIMNNVMQQMIISGQDPYSSSTSSQFAPSSFYHSYITINAAPVGGAGAVGWHLDNTSTNVSSTDIDFYTVFLHEIMHALGFMSMIDGNGVSKAGASHNFFSIYDQYLRNASGQALLTSATTLTAPYNVTDFIFSGSTLAIQSGSICSTSATYSSSSISNIKVNSSVVFSPGSSLSHFDDACSTPTNYVPAPSCSLSPNYFVMHAGAGTGSCNIRRYPKEEERYALCDLGYEVNNTYTSTAADANHTYTGSACSGIGVWGVNDGIQNGLYTYASAVGVNTISIPITGTAGILANDATTASTIGGLQVIYNNATYTNTGNDLLVTASLSVTGLVLIKYYPETSGGVIGNATYIYVYFVPGNCSPPNFCNMVQNGDFENTMCGNGVCGQISGGGTCFNPNFPAALSCWGTVDTPDLHTYSSCSFPQSYLAGNAMGSDYNSSLGANVVGIGVSPGISYEGVSTILSTSLSPGHSYQLSLAAYNVSTFAPAPEPNLGQRPIVIRVASQQIASAVPVLSLNVLTQFTVSSLNTWVTLTNTFVFPSSITVPHGAITVFAHSLVGAGSTFGYACIDNIFLDALSTPTFIIPNSTVCGTYPAPAYTITTPSFTNLAQYASPVSGTFSGVGVTQNTTSGQYHFNPSGTLTTGTYPIAFTYSTMGGCVNTLYQNISFISPTAAIVASSNTICIGETVTLTAIGNLTGFMWGSPWDNLNVNPLVVSPTVNTSYLLTGATPCGHIASAPPFTYPSANIYVNPVPTLTVSASNTGTLCLGATTTLTAAGSFTSVLWQPGGYTTSAIVVSPTAAIVYTVIANPLCSPVTQTLAFDVGTVSVAAPTLNLSSSANGVLCPGASVTLSAIGNQTSTLWQPGDYTTSVIVVTPTVTTVYTVTGNPACVSAVATITVLATPIGTNTTVNQLSTTLTNFTSNWSEVYSVNADVTVNGVVNFEHSEFIFAPNVKITVTAGSVLNINHAHLFACAAYMWQGIVVQDGGAVYIFNDSMIEDAVTAIDASNQYTSTVQPIILAQYAIFNKNYTDIALTNYSTTTAGVSDVMYIDNCVFTCRNIPFGVSSSIYDLRSATSTTTGLAAPYLQTYSTSILKLPYGYMGKPRGIYLGNVGYVTASGIYEGIIIGDMLNANSFNLFDNHGVFINAENSNLALYNNVFQNQVGGFIVTPIAPSAPVMYGHPAAAVMHRTYDNRKTQLDMTTFSAFGTERGNRFWDCNRGVEGRNINKFSMTKAIMRSAHTWTADVFGQSYVARGEYGVNLHSNRIDYNIKDNEFTNLNVGIGIPVTYYGGTAISGLAVYNNKFSAPSTGFMGAATYVLGSLSVPSNTTGMYDLTAIPSTTLIPKGIAIVNNTVSGVWNGFGINGTSYLPAWIAANDVTLTDDNDSWVTTQHGIEFLNLWANADEQQHIYLNSVHGISPSSTYTKTNMSLVYGNNNIGYMSPLISCNTVKYAHKGFTFAGQNAPLTTPYYPYQGTQWLGNKMEDLNRGMYLKGFASAFGGTVQGVISPQGNATAGMGNEWTAGTYSWTGTNYGILTDNSSPTLSPLYTNTLSNMPPNPSNGNGISSLIYGIGNGIISATGNYGCSPPAPLIAITPAAEDNSYQSYLTRANFYHFLKYNHSFRASNAEFNDWYNDMTATSNLGYLESAQERLYNGNFSGARELLNGLTADNDIEGNDINYYNLYANYLEALNENTMYASADSLALLDMTYMCPIEYGSTIYKARALYSDIYSVFIRYDDCNAAEMGGRFAATTQQSEILNQSEIWNVELYPNPAQNEITIKSNHESEDLNIVITDVLGRIVQQTHLKINAFVANVKLDLLNGAYVVRLTNNQNKIVSKKLLIAK